MTDTTLRLAFMRGISPSKWAQRWPMIMPSVALELVSVSADASGRARGVSECDVLLERVQPGTTPDGVDGPMRSRHGLRLYVEDVALVVAKDHELAGYATIDSDDLELVHPINHPDHANVWPTAKEWVDDSFTPKDAEWTLELIASGAGVALMPLPLARHLSGKRPIIAVKVMDDDHKVPGTEVWATWAVDRDADDIQTLVGVLRGRTPRSSR